MGLTRRDFFTFGIGAAAAIPLTPAPWKLLDDTAKWSQNWSWIARPPRGERSVRFSTCTLCPAGCGLQVKCVANNLIGIAPVSGHPVSKGVLCPYAFGAHQLRYHTARLTQPLRNGLPDTIQRVTAEIASRVKSGKVGILDERPGRAVSAAYQKLGTYLTVAPTESTTLQHFAASAGLNSADLGLDLANVRTLVSFGAPVLESWATPGRVLGLWKNKQLAIIQVESELSKTAALASVWIPEDAGSVARALAGGPRTPRVEQALRLIQDRGVMLAISGGDLTDDEERAIAALNHNSKAIVSRTSGQPVPETSLSALPDGSLDVLFIDHGPLGGSISYDPLRPKLRRDGIIVSLSPYRAGVAALADYVIPAPAFAETLDEAPTPWDAVMPSYSIASAIAEPPSGAVHPLAFLNQVTGGTTTPDVAMRARVDALYAAKRGEVFLPATRSSQPITGFKSTDEVWKALLAGACWTDSHAAAKPVAFRADTSIRTTARATRSRRPAVSPPLFTKLEQESRLGRA